MKKNVFKSILVALTLALTFTMGACAGGSGVAFVNDLTKDGKVYQVTGTVRTTTAAAVEDNEGDGSTYNLRVWCADEDYEMIGEMLESYKAKYSANHYNFTLERQGEDVVSGTVMKDPEAAADVFSFANDQLGWLIKSKSIMSIPDEYSDQIDKQISVARNAAKDSTTGIYYAFPYSYENCFLYYNKSLITDVSSLEGILKQSISGVSANLYIDMGDSYYTTAFLYTAGVEIFGANGDDPNSIDFGANNEKAKKACAYIKSLNAKTKLVSEGDKNNQVAALKQKKVAAIISGPHMISAYKSALGKDFAVATLPTIELDGKAQPLISFAGVKMYGISSKSAKARDQKTTNEAVKLAAYLSNEENQIIRLEKREFCPTQKDLFESSVNSGKETIKVVYEQSFNSKLKSGLTKMDSYWSPMGNFLKGVYTLNRGEGTWDKYLNDIKSKLLEIG